MLLALWLLALPLDPALQEAARLPRLHSLLVSQHGELIVERYLHGARPGGLANLKSASKSVISALVGIAIGQGLLPDVHAPIASFFPALVDPEKRKITVEDLLTMRSGLASTSNRNYGAWVRSPNWVRYVLNRPLLGPPGEQMSYSTGNTHLLSAILTKASGTDTWSFAQDALARPLGITLARWPQDPQGIYFGGNEMLLTPRQMVAFGELYLHHGRAHGRQIVPAAWVDASWTPRTRSPRNDRPYGYGWWIEDLAGHCACYAWGFGGQYIFVVPDLDLVVAATSSATAGEDRRGHRSALFDIVERLIIAPLGA